MPDASIGELPLARASTLVQKIHEELKARIIDGRLAAGSEVPDSVVAKQMGVSRAPVRDACNILVMSGLLTKSQNYPYRVREFSMSDFDELQLIRWGLESAAARHLVRHKTKTRATEQPLETMAEAYQKGDGLLSWRADIDFHLAFVRSTGLPELGRLHEAALQQLAMSVRDVPLFAVPTQVHRHQELLDVLSESQRDGSPDAILHLLTVHLLTRRADVEENEILRPPAGAESRPA